MELPIYTHAGKQNGSLSLPETVFGAAWNADLVHQVVSAMQANSRPIVAHTKDRSEVSGGGKKPWRQKGTGNARHGSIRSPLWRSGGATFGPRKERSFAKRIPKGFKTAALRVLLSRKYRDGEIIALEDFTFDAPKTASAKHILDALRDTGGFAGIPNAPRRAVYILIPEHNATVFKSFRNFGSVRVDAVQNVRIVDLVRYKYVVFAGPEAVVAALAARVDKPARRAAETESEPASVTETK